MQSFLELKRLRALKRTTGVLIEKDQIPDRFKKGGFSVRLPFDLGDVALLGNVTDDPREHLFGIVLHLPYSNPRELVEEIIKLNR